jgi:hypothetical protein
MRIYTNSSSEVIEVKLTKTMMLMALGAGSVIMYQKYNKPLMKKMSNMMNKMDDKLEDMM